MLLLWPVFKHLKICSAGIFGPVSCIFLLMTALQESGSKERLFWFTGVQKLSFTPYILISTSKALELQWRGRIHLGSPGNLVKIWWKFGDEFVTKFGDSLNWSPNLVTNSSPHLVTHQISHHILQTGHPICHQNWWPIWWPVFPHIVATNSSPNLVITWFSPNGLITKYCDHLICHQIWWQICHQIW